MSVHPQSAEGASPAYLYIASGEGGIHRLPLAALRTAVQTGAGQGDDAFQSQLRLQEASNWQKVFFLGKHPRLGVLYALDIGAATIGTYRIGADGELHLLGRCPSGDAAPCHLAVDPQGRFLLVAHYNGGLGCYPLNADGVPQAEAHGAAAPTAVGAATAVTAATASAGEPDGGAGVRLAGGVARLHFEGSGPVEQRQSRSHPHGVVLDNSGQWAYVADLGTDSVYAVHVDAAKGALVNITEHRVALVPGDGPRHCVLSVDGRLAAVVNELSNTVTVFEIRRAGDAEPGCWVQRGRQPTLPEGWSGVSHTAEVAFNAAADTLYVTNRGHDSVAVFAVDAATGALGTPRWIMAAGKAPQHLLLAEGGALQQTESDTLRWAEGDTLQRAEGDTGALRQTKGDALHHAGSATGGEGGVAGGVDDAAQTRQTATVPQDGETLLLVANAGSDEVVVFCGSKGGAVRGGADVGTAGCGAGDGAVGGVCAPAAVIRMAKPLCLALG